MKTSKLQLQPTVVLLLSLFFVGAAHAQMTPLADSYIDTATSTKNYGAAALLNVDGTSEVTYIQFDLASIPSGATVSGATLKLYVNGVTTAGSFNVDYVNAAWTESTIDASNAPTPGTTIASNVNISAADRNQYILIDVTSAVQAWLSGAETNNGIALVANSTFNATFDSKENTTTSHPAEIDVVFAGGSTLTGINTAAGSGLTGGGESGTLDLSLTTACAVNQVLAWNGSAWACANISSGGGGTITGVTAGTGLTGGGASGNVTLAVDPTQVPLLTATNTFNGTQTVGSGDVALTSGNLDLPQTSGATVGVITMGGAPFISACCANNTFNTFVGENAGNFNAQGNNNTALGYQALNSINSLSSTANTAVGTTALKADTTGSSNTALGTGALQINTSGTSNTAVGTSALAGNFQGLWNTGVGQGAGLSNTSGNSNTFIGTGADAGSGGLTYAVAIGANAVVAESHALVLGGTSANGSAVNVGIGTTTPAYGLDVYGTGHFTQPVTFDSTVNFASGQTFPGTITGITAGTGLSGGGSSGNITLGNTGVLSLAAGTGISVTSGQSPTVSLNTARVPLLSSPNTFTANQTINGNATVNGTLSASAVNTTLAYVEGNKTPVTAVQGAYLAWNALTGGTGETDFINNAGLGGGAFAFMNTNSSGSPRSTLMFINGGGQVGINTVSPYSILEADANAPGALGPALTLTNNGSGQGATSAVDFNSYTPNPGPYNPTARIAAVDQGNYSNDIVFSTNQPGAANNGLQEHFRIKSTGGVSIDGDTPMSHNPHMSFSTTFVGSLCPNNTNCGGSYGTSWGAFVPDYAIRITRIIATLNESIDPSCGPAYINVYSPYWAGGTNFGSVSLPTNTGFLDSGPLAISIPPGQVIFVVPFITGGCNFGASAGGDVYMNTQYVMQ